MAVSFCNTSPAQAISMEQELDTETTSNTVAMELYE